MYGYNIHVHDAHYEELEGVRWDILKKRLDSPSVPPHPQFKHQGIYWFTIKN